MCDLYSYVEFKNVSADKMKEFVKLYCKEDLTGGTWNKICERLYNETQKEEEEEETEYVLNKRYKRKVKISKDVKVKIFKEIFFLM